MELSRKAMKVFGDTSFLRKKEEVEEASINLAKKVLNKMTELELDKSRAISSMKHKCIKKKDEALGLGDFGELKNLTIKSKWYMSAQHYDRILFLKGFEEILDWLEEEEKKKTQEAVEVLASISEA